nr:hypothetical protein BaRGS_028796 [Batillaria attramentaria]
MKGISCPPLAGGGQEREDGLHAVAAPDPLRTTDNCDYDDNISCFSGDSDYTVFRGFPIRNYVRPQHRYKVDPFLTSRRERLMLRLSMENPVFLNGSRNEHKAEVVFPKKARRKVLQELVEKNSAPVRKEDKGVVPPELRAKIDEFFKTLEPLCPKPNFSAE